MTTKKSASSYAPHFQPGSKNLLDTSKENIIRMEALLAMIIAKVEVRGNTHAEQAIRVKKVFQAFDPIGEYLYCTVMC
jgi:hypothetical protein